MVPIPFQFPLCMEEVEVDVQVADLKEHRKCIVISDRYRSILLLQLWTEEAPIGKYLYILPWESVKKEGKKSKTIRVTGCGDL
jgi:hypothetical protein